MTFGCSRPWFALLATAFPLTVACSSDDPAPGNQSGGTGGSGTMAGTGGSAGKAAAGQGGTSGTGGSSGAGGSSGSSAGSGGQGGAAVGGSAGSGAGGSGAGAAGRAGGAGAGAGGSGAGMGGTAGSAGGMGGASAGMAGASGGMGGATAGSGGSGGGGTFTLTLKSADFMNVAGCSETMQSVCDTFPTELISFNMNANVSPELDWTGVPAGTQSFAVLLQDLSNTYAHWVLWNIPGTATMLASGVDKSTNKPAVPAGSQQANLSSGDGYFGPGSACNVYEFVVYALSIPTFSPSPVTDGNTVRTQLLALGDKILGTASVRGRPNLCSGTQKCDSKNMCVN